MSSENLTGPIRKYVKAPCFQGNARMLASPVSSFSQHDPSLPRRAFRGVPLRLLTLPPAPPDLSSLHRPSFQWLLAMSEDLYEVMFHKERLGFSVTNEEGTGTIVVNRIQDPDLLESVDSALEAKSEEERTKELVAMMMEGSAATRKPLETVKPSQQIYLGDTVLAINGAPLGWVTDHQVRLKVAELVVSVVWWKRERVRK